MDERGLDPRGGGVAGIHWNVPDRSSHLNIATAFLVVDKSIYSKRTTLVKAECSPVGSIDE